MMKLEVEEKNKLQYSHWIGTTSDNDNDNDNDNILFDHRHTKLNGLETTIKTN